MDVKSPAILPGSRGLWQADRKYSDVISVLSEGIVIVTREGIQESNASADRILGLHVAGQDGCVAEDPTTELYNADGSRLKREDHPCYITLGTGHSFTNHIMGFRRPGGPMTWCSLNTRAIWTTPGEAPDTVVASVRDVTEELANRALIEQARVEAEARARELEIEQRRLKDVLEELRAETELRESFVSTMTHDLRTPLSIAMISAQLLLRDVNDASPAHRGGERLLGSIRRIDRMIRDLLDASRLKAGQGLPIQKTRQCLTAVIRESCDGLKEISGDRLVASLEDAAEGDFCAHGVARIVENLVINAKKYGFPDTPIAVSMQTRDNIAEIVVHNFGNPISPEAQAKLFEPYFRHKGMREESNLGWGLGLSLVKGIALAHGGQVSVSSSEAEGTRFAVTIPL